MNKNCNKLNIANILLCIIIIGILAVGGYNFKYNAKFLSVNIGLILSLLIAVVFAYFLSQRKLDERKKKDQIEYLLQKMQNMLLEKFVINIQSRDDLNYNTLFQKSFDNRIKILNDLKSTLIKKDNLDYLLREFNEYKDFIGENYDNVQHLNSSKKTLSRLISNIDFMLDELIFSLYKE